MKAKTLGWAKSSGFSFVLLFIYLFIYFRAAVMAYGSPQSRGRIRAIAAGLCHSHINMGSRLHLHHSSWQCQILNRLGKAGD